LTIGFLGCNNHEILNFINLILDAYNEFGIIEYSGAINGYYNMGYVIKFSWEI
jgi:hypothetical protein